MHPELPICQALFSPQKSDKTYIPCLLAVSNSVRETARKLDKCTSDYHGKERESSTGSGSIEPGLKRSEKKILPLTTEDQ